MLDRPIGILDEHPEWSRRLIDALDARRLPYEKIDHSSHGFDPRDHDPHYSVSSIGRARRRTRAATAACSSTPKRCSRTTRPAAFR